MQHIYFTFC